MKYLIIGASSGLGKELVIKFKNNYKEYDLGDNDIKNGGPL